MKYKVKRLTAYLIDWFISSLIYIFITLLYYSMITQTKTTRIDFYQVSFYQGILIISLCLFVYFIYYAMIPIYNNGQTPGKKVCHLEVFHKYDTKYQYVPFSLKFITMLLGEGFLFYPTFVILQFMECHFNADIVAILYKISVITSLISVFIYLLTNKFIHDYTSHSNVTMKT